MNAKVISAGSYNVVVGDVLDELDQFIQTHFADHVPIILGDTNTITHALQLIDYVGVASLKEAEVLEVEPGETSKDIEVVNGLWQTLLELEAQRKTLLINLGGGMITDLGGFLAGTYKRGIPFIQMPTSLLAMVDASVGGKVGINLGVAKNQVGLFLEPQAVFAHIPFLDSLPLRERQAGMAEMLKHGLVTDADHWSELLQLKVDDISSEAWLKTIHTSVSIKQHIVAQDFKESGVRKKLNFGHTIGHAIESWSHEHKPLLHGEAIFIGMWCETWLSHAFGQLSLTERDQIHQALAVFIPDISINQIHFDSILNWMKADKKNEGALLNFTLLSTIGNSDVNRELTPEQVVQGLEAFQSR